MSMRIAYFPGCALEGTAQDYALSLEAIAPKLGLQLEELEDWNCCGATAAHNLNHKLSLALPARILALAERGGYESLVAPCAACSHRLITTAHVLEARKELRQEIAGVIELPYAGTVRVKNILQVLQELGVENIVAACTRKLTGLKIASYYGCLLVRPPKVVKFDDPEAPQSMDRIIRALGGTPVDWGLKTECCGGGFSMSRTDLVCKLVRELLDNAASEGAEAFAVACPMCQSNLDLRQQSVNQRYGTQFKLPALYITQWIGLCLGLSERELGIDQHFVDAHEVVGKAFAPPLTLPSPQGGEGGVRGAQKAPAAAALAGKA
ncbi:MAG: CoB--CoM heterodisulfide reductase iron-sulfur subunit B family protein [Planctomycetota bacterium]